jgi:flagellar hook-basal body complex protein FliE
MTGIGGVAAVAPTAYLTPATSGVQSVAGSAFGEALTSAVDGVSAAQKESSDLAIKAVTGDLTDIHDATIAAARASVTLELVAAVRNKGVEAFTEIMRMQA